MGKKRFISLLIALAACMAVFISCSKAASSTGSGTAPAAPAAAKIDMTAYALAAATPLSDADKTVDWQAKSSNPNKILWRHGITNRNLDESPVERSTRQLFIELKKRLGDKVEIQLYTGGTLGTSADQIIGGLQSRAFESYSYNVGAFAEYTNAFLPLDVMYLIPDIDAAMRITDGEPGQIMRQKCIDDTGVNVLIYSVVGMRHITNSRQTIRAPKDLQGMKLRVMPNPLYILAIQQLGASPTPISYSELFTALQQKVVDGQENPITNIFDSNFGEVQRYLTITNHLYTAGAFSINDSWLKEQSAEFRQAVKESVDIAWAYSQRETKMVESKLLDELKNQMEITYLTDAEFKAFQDACRGSWDKAAERIGVDYFNKVKASMEKIIAN
jgi:C4-dicarboxylate-binding protein DctP